jgi:putative ABC transport system permease protein
VAREWQVANGRSFAGDEIASGSKVAIVGSVIVEELFNGRTGVGETFRIGNVPFTVIGVLDKKGLGAAGRSQDDVVFIPLSAAKSRVLGAVRGTTREALDFITIKTSNAAAMPEIERELEALLRQRHRIHGDARFPLLMAQKQKSLCRRQNLLPRLWRDRVGADRAGVKFPPQRRVDQ